jgi:integrase
MGVSVRQKDGKPYVFVRHQGQRVAFKYETEGEANDVAKAFRQEIALGRLDILAIKKQREAKPNENPSTPTLKEYFEKHFTKEYLESGLRQSTQDSYRGAFDRHILPILGEKPIDQITRANVKAFVGHLTKKTYKRLVVEKTKDAEGNPVRREKISERPLSRASIRIVMAELTAVLNHAKEDGHIAANPAGRLGKLYKNTPIVHKEIQPLTHEEVPIFLETARIYFPEYFVLFLCAIHTGMRSGELAGLQWPDIDFKGKFLFARRSLIRGRTEKTKTDRIRRVDLSDTLLHELDALKKRRKEGYLARGKNEIPEWVFLGPGAIIWEDGKPAGHKEGSQVDMYNVKNRYFLKCLEKAGLRRIRFHDLRHTYASLLIQNGESLAYVKDQLGHSSIKMTVDVYGHLVPGANREAVNRLPHIILSTPEDLLSTGSAL